MIYPIANLAGNEPTGDAIDPSEVVMAIVAVAPSAAKGADHRVVVFQARDSSRPDAPVVDATETA